MIPEEPSHFFVQYLTLSDTTIPERHRYTATHHFFRCIPVCAVIFDKVLIHYLLHFSKFQHVNEYGYENKAYI